VSAGRPALRLVTGLPAAAPSESVRFCGFCAHVPPAADIGSRICTACGLGVVLEAAADIAPAPGEPFLVVDRTLSICALSESGAERLGVDEQDAVNRPLLELLEPADMAAVGPSALTGALLAAGDGVLRVVVRPAGTFGVRLRARIGPCGSPPATLVVLEPLGRRPASH
jgi:hypothetical protein